MIVSVAPFYYLQGFTKRMMKETCKFYFHMMHFERRFVGRHLSFLLMFLLFHVGETPSGQKIVVLSALYNKTNKNILKYQLCVNALAYTPFPFSQTLPLRCHATKLNHSLAYFLINLNTLFFLRVHYCGLSDFSTIKVYLQLLQSCMEK